MGRTKFQGIVLLILLLTAEIHNSEIYGKGTLSSQYSLQDTTSPNLPLYNGRLWRNLYILVKGNAFFMTGEFLSGSITFNGKVFNNVNFRYDTFNDEIDLWINPQTIIILNKEMVNKFTINYMGRLYNFIKMKDDTAGILKGYVQVLYDGTSALYVKHKKKIDQMAVDGQFDLFYDTQRTYVRQKDNYYSISGRRDLYRLLDSRKKEIRNYVRRNRLTVKGKEPETFIQVLKFYDTLF